MEACTATGFTCLYTRGSNFTKHCLAKPKLSWKTFLATFLGGKTKQTNKRTEVKVQPTLPFKVLKTTGQWTESHYLVVEGIQFGGAVPSLRLAFSLALAVISEPITMAAQVSWWRDATTKCQVKGQNCIVVRLSNRPIIFLAPVYTPRFSAQ